MAHPNSFLIDEPDGLYPWFDAWIKQADVMSADHRDVIVKAAQKYTDDRRFLSQFSQLETMNLILKAPNLTYRHEELDRLGVSTHILYPVRDVRSVVASMSKLSNIRMTENQTRFLESSPFLSSEFREELSVLNDGHVAEHIKKAVIWKAKTGFYKQYVSRGMNPCVFKYENLVESPSIWGKHITSHCEITFSDRQTKYHDVLVGSGPGNTSRERPIDKASLERWSSVLSADQITEICAVAGDTMLELGYDF